MARRLAARSTAPLITPPSTRKGDRCKPAAQTFSIGHAMVYLTQNYEIEFCHFCHDGVRWFFARVTEHGQRRTYCLVRKDFLRFLRRAFPSASNQFLICLARRCRFVAWLTSVPPGMEDHDVDTLCVA